MFSDVCLFSLFRSASPSVPPPSVPRGSLGGAKYLGSLPADQPDSAERPGRLQGGMEGEIEGGSRGRRDAERGTSISFSNDKLTLSKMYVMSHQSQLIKSLAAPSSFLWPSLPTQTERREKRTASSGSNLRKQSFLSNIH